MHVIFDLFPGICPTYQLSALNQLLKQIQIQFNVNDLLNELDNKHDAFLLLIQQFVREHTQINDINDEQLTLIQKTVTGILYLLIALQTSSAGSNPIIIKKGFSIEFKSQIPLGAGLGSSAAFAVCVSAAFYIYTLSQNQPDFIRTFNQLSDEERQYFYETISSWAFMSERIMHGTPSGLDNTVCTFGNVVQFTKNPKRFLNVTVNSTINIMLVNTGVSRNTSEIVGKVRDLKNDHTKVIDCVLNAMGALVEDVVEVNSINFRIIHKI